MKLGKKKSNLIVESKKPKINDKNIKWSSTKPTKLFILEYNKKKFRNKLLFYYICIYSYKLKIFIT